MLLLVEIERMEDVAESLDASREEMPVDQKVTEIVGEEAIKKYYNHYKKIEKVKEENQVHNISDSAYTIFLDQAKQKKLYPTKFGVVKKKGRKEKIDIKNFTFGDKYIEALSHGIQNLPKVNEYNLRSNRITELGASAILNKLSKNIKSLNLSQNNIGKIGCQLLANQLEDRGCRIDTLNLEGNKLGDKSVTLIIHALEKNYSLTSLNLSNNYLSNESIFELCDVFQQNSYLQEIYLNWNQIKAEGGQSLFNSLIDNENVRVLDISWNTLGKIKTSSCQESLCEMLVKNKHLIHFDLSNNSFTLGESIAISKALEVNQSIYGFHFGGNFGYVNDLQQLVVDENTIKSQCAQIIGHKIEGLKCNKVVKRQYGEIYKDGCWICEGWREIDFTWFYGPSGVGYQTPGFLLLDHKGWEGVFLGRINKPTKSFPIKRMVPPGILYFMYSFKFREFNNRKNIRVSSKIFQPLTVHYADQQKQVVLLQMNMLEKQAKLIIENESDDPDESREVGPKGLINEDFSANISILPRTKDLIYVPPKEKKEKVPWDFNKSIFKPYQVDNLDLLKKCFEFDFSCSKISRLIKDEEDLAKTKEYLWSHYKEQKNCFKYYASLNPIGEIWCLQNLEFHTFVDKMCLKDNKLRNAEVDLKFVGTNANIDMKGPRNPERGLIRFQFMESLVRMAEEKYIKSSAVNTYVDALKKMYDEHCLDEFKRFDHQIFRDQYYWSEQCEMVILHYKQLIENIYNKYSVKKVNPGQKKFMCLEEVIDICKTADLFLDANLLGEDASQAFNLAVQTQVDEINQSRIFQLSLLEFYETLARIANKLSLPELGRNRMSNQERQEQELHTKYESLIVKLIEKLIPGHHIDKKNKSMFNHDEESEPSSEEEGPEEILAQVGNSILDQSENRFKKSVRKSIALGMKPFKVKDLSEDQKKEKEQEITQYNEQLLQIKQGVGAMKQQQAEILQQIQEDEEEEQIKQKEKEKQRKAQEMQRQEEEEDKKKQKVKQEFKQKQQQLQKEKEEQESKEKE